MHAVCACILCVLVFYACAYDMCLYITCVYIYVCTLYVYAKTRHSSKILIFEFLPTLIVYHRYTIVANLKSISCSLQEI